MAEEGASRPASRKKKTEDWELNPNDLKVIEAIGQGSTASVYWATLHGHDIAVKEIQAVDDGTLLAVRRELQVMNKVDHPHLLKIVGLVSKTPPLRLCLEFCSGGTLFDLLHNMWHIQLRWQQRLKILYDMASAMEYLHTFRKPIMHRDLKSLNVFLRTPVDDQDSEIDVKIADFGFSRIRSKGATDADWSSMTQGAGSIHWMAPEVFMGTKYSSKADVFSFGIVIYEVVCRHMAFEDKDADSAGQLIAAGQRPTFEHVPQSAPPELVNLMQRCWAQSPVERPTFTEIYAELVAIHANLPDLPADC
eukprot:TRINITY_DN71249_c0_g1_i1.p1 TRINITY_DN71249_c0_g1~~TRINITY_DN71249_c0_g1_i1.p1  ORF type:complete len:306 (+),score=46.86 TRINITY_DN71249_c0_g1_i1:106-1023(+)